MTLKRILPMIVIFIVLYGTTITVSADENSIDSIGINEKQFIHQPPELPAKYGVKLVNTLRRR